MKTVDWEKVAVTLQSHSNDFFARARLNSGNVGTAMLAAHYIMSGIASALLTGIKEKE